MHGNILCFTLKPSEYVTQNEDELFTKIENDIDYVEAMTLTKEEINQYASDFAKELNASCDGNCIIIDNPQKRYVDYVFAEIKSIVNNDDSLKDKSEALRRINRMFRDELPSTYIYYYDSNIILNEHEFVEVANLLLQKKSKSLKLYLMEVFDFHV